MGKNIKLNELNFDSLNVFFEIYDKKASKVCYFTHKSIEKHIFLHRQHSRLNVCYGNLTKKLKL